MKYLLTTTALSGWLLFGVSPVHAQRTLQLCDGATAATGPAPLALDADNRLCLMGGSGSGPPPVVVDTSGVSGGKEHCPYDTFDMDECGATEHFGFNKIASDDFFGTVAPQTGQTYKHTLTGSIKNNVLTVTDGPPLSIHQTIRGGVTPEGIYVKSQIDGATYQLSGSGLNIASRELTAINRPPFNLIGIDYEAGHYTDIDKMTDPKDLDLSGTGCEYQIDKSPVKGPQILCKQRTAAVADKLKHLNLSSLNGHKCTFIQFQSMTTAPDSILEDLYFKNDKDCLNNFTNTTSLIFYTVTVPTNTPTYAVSYSTFDGMNMDPCCDMTGSGGAPSGSFARGAGVSAMAITNHGDIKIHHNWFNSWPGQNWGVIGGPGSTGVGVQSIDHNFVRSNQASVAVGHSAIGSIGGSTSSTYAWNVALYDKEVVAGKTAILSGQTTDSTVQGDWISDHNLFITNNTNGLPKVGAGTATVDIKANGVITVTNLTKLTVLSRNMSVGGLDAYLWNNIGGGTGEGSQWTYHCGANNLSGNSLKVCAPATTGNGYFNVQQGVVPPGTGVAPGVFPGIYIYDAPINYIVLLLHGKVGRAKFTDNWFDTSGVQYNPALSAKGAKCGTTTISTGNIDMVAGQPADAYSADANSGC